MKPGFTVSSISVPPLTQPNVIDSKEENVRRFTTSVVINQAQTARATVEIRGHRWSPTLRRSEDEENSALLPTCGARETKRRKKKREFEESACENAAHQRPAHRECTANYFV